MVNSSVCHVNTAKYDLMDIDLCSWYQTAGKALVLVIGVALR